jgi:hypothetical protein
LLKAEFGYTTCSVYKVGVLIMAYVVPLSSALVQSESLADHGFAKDLRYLVGFAVVGLLVSILCFAVTPTEYLPNGASALAPEMQTITGLTLS